MISNGAHPADAYIATMGNQTVTVGIDAALSASGVGFVGAEVAGQSYDGVLANSVKSGLYTFSQNARQGTQNVSHQTRKTTGSFLDALGKFFGM